MNSNIILRVPEVTTPKSPSKINKVARGSIGYSPAELTKFQSPPKHSTRKQVSPVGASQRVNVSRLIEDLSSMRTNMRAIQQSNQRLVDKIHKKVHRASQSNGDILTLGSLELVGKHQSSNQDLRMNCTSEKFMDILHTDRSNNAFGSMEKARNTLPNFDTASYKKQNEGLLKFKSTIMLLNSRQYLSSDEQPAVREALSRADTLFSCVLTRIQQKCEERLRRLEGHTNKIANQILRISRMYGYKCKLVQQQKLELIEMKQLLSVYEKRFNLQEDEIMLKSSQLAKAKAQINQLSDSLTKLKSTTTTSDTKHQQQTHVRTLLSKITRGSCADRMHPHNYQNQTSQLHFGSREHLPTANILNIEMVNSTQLDSWKVRHSLGKAECANRGQQRPSLAMLSTYRVTPSKCSRQQPSLNISLEEEPGQLSNLRLREHIQRLRQIIRQKNNVIAHLHHKLQNPEQKQEGMSEFSDNFSLPAWTTDKYRPSKCSTLKKKLEQQSLDFISKLMDQLQHQQSALQAAQQNEKAFLQLKQSYKQQISRLNEIAERYQRFYQQDMRAKGGGSPIPRKSRIY